MSRALLICTRRPDGLGVHTDAACRLNRTLTPDNIVPVPPCVRTSRGLLLAALNPRESLEVRGTSLCLGLIHEADGRWAEPGSPIPDGSFALIRADDDHVELASDITGSRTIWYAHTADCFVASSSQRAVVSVLEGFEPNRLAFAWFLSSGTLGPGLAWDTRVQALPPNARLRLDRSAWTVSLQEEPVRLAPEPGSYRDWEDAMQADIRRIFSAFENSSCRWAVPLSGGCDSRAILTFLPDRSRFEAVTWGTAASLQDPLADSAVAQRVARALGVRHRFFPMDAPTLPVETIVQRYLVAGEGRVDHLAGYVDGFQVWQWLYDEGFNGILRGDVCWPHLDAAPATPLCVRQNSMIQLLRLCDYRNLAGAEELDLPDQPLPERYEPGEHESLWDYGDRIYQEFRLPWTLAALNDLKAAYVEVANPFLCARFVRLARRLPARIRRNKRLLKGIVAKEGPPIPLARRSAILPMAGIVRQAAMHDFLGDELSSAHARGLLNGTLLNAAVEGLVPGRTDSDPSPRRRAGPVRRMARRLLRSMSAPRPLGQPILPLEILALRATLISRMCRLLAEDGRMGQRTIARPCSERIAVSDPPLPDYETSGPRDR